MTTIIDKREHEELDYEEIGNHVALDGIPMANCGTPDRLLGLTVTDIKARTLRTGYYIGAAWIAEGDTALRVSPKIEGIDWLRMFTDCFYEADDEIQKHIHNIYQIDFDKPKIEYNGGTSMLTPFIIAHFLFLVKNIVRKGLKKDYRHEEQNLEGKLKGRLLFTKQLKKNIAVGRLDRNFCRYQTFSENCLENRIIRHALLYARNFMTNNHSTFNRELHELLAKNLAAFAGVTEITSRECMVTLHTSPVFHDYKRTLKVARMIIRRFDCDMQRSQTEHDTLVPPFWINMPLLFELYMLGKLRMRHGKGIKYHTRSTGNEIDFGKPSEQLIIDTKYTTKWSDDGIVAEHIRQLAGYARNKNIRKRLGVTDDNVIMNCMIAYPDSNGASEFTSANIQDEPAVKAIDSYIKTYKIGIRLPELQQ